MQTIKHWASFQPRFLPQYPPTRFSLLGEHTCTHTHTHIWLFHIRFIAHLKLHTRCQILYKQLMYMSVSVCVCGPRINAFHLTIHIKIAPFFPYQLDRWSSFYLGLTCVLQVSHLFKCCMRTPNWSVSLSDVQSFADLYTSFRPCENCTNIPFALCNWTLPCFCISPITPHCDVHALYT